jgi:small subunit ribosomal protein S6
LSNTNRKYSELFRALRDLSIVATNTYELLLILDSNHYARDPGSLGKQIEEIVTEAGGSVLVNRLWMEQRLAYPIDKHQKGTYWLTYFESPGTAISKIDRALKLYEPAIRHMAVKLEPRLVEPILANARGESVRVSTPSDSETAPEPGESGAGESGAGEKAKADEAVAVEA